jgi:hypothetical protein
MYNKQIFNKELSRQEYLIQIYENTKEINKNGRQDLDRLYSFSHLIDSSIFSMGFGYTANDKLDIIGGFLLSNDIIDKHGLTNTVPAKEIKDKDIINQVKNW